MKNMLIALLLFSAASASAGPSVATGKSSVYRMKLQPQSLLLEISGNTAKEVWNSLSERSEVLDITDLASIEQKVGQNITCNKYFYRFTKKTKFDCSITLTSGKAEAGAAG